MAIYVFYKNELVYIEKVTSKHQWLLTSLSSTKMDDMFQEFGQDYDITFQYSVWNTVLDS